MLESPIKTYYVERISPIISATPQTSQNKRSASLQISRSPILRWTPAARPGKSAQRSPRSSWESWRLSSPTTTTWPGSAATRSPSIWTSQRDRYAGLSPLTYNLPNLSLQINSPFIYESNVLTIKKVFILISVDLKVKTNLWSQKSPLKKSLLETLMSQKLKHMEREENDRLTTMLLVSHRQIFLVAKFSNNSTGFISRCIK